MACENLALSDLFSTLDISLFTVPPNYVATRVVLDGDTFIRKRNNPIQVLKRPLVAYANEKLIRATANLQSSRKDNDEPHH